MTDLSHPQITGKNIAVVGGGVVGAAIALRLVLSGAQVTLYEPNEPGSGCSMGNSGHIGISSIVPWASPAIVKHSVKMLLDPLHPLYVSPLGWLENAGWFYSFIKAARPDSVKHGISVLSGLFANAAADADTLIAAAQAYDLVSDRGVIQVYSSEGTFKNASKGDDLRRRNGVEMIPLSTAELHELEPALGPVAQYGTLIPGVRHVLTPQGLPQRWVTNARERGLKVIARPVSAIRPAEGQKASVVVDGQTSVFDKVVLAAGFASRAFFNDAGVTVPLASERGYHIQMTGQRDLISRAISYVDGRVGFSPMLDGIRLTSGADFSHSTSPVRYERARRIFNNAKQLLPDLGELKGREWCDARPSTPDSLPIMGFAPNNPGLILATGHGHVGLGLSGVSARIVCALIAGENPGVDMAGIAPNRTIGSASAKAA